VICGAGDSFREQHMDEIMKECGWTKEDLGEEFTEQNKNNSAFTAVSNAIEEADKRGSILKPFFERLL
jgi:hypothetical protein